MAIYTYYSTLIGCKIKISEIMIRDLNIPNMSLQRKLYRRMENLKKTALMPSLMRLSRHEHKEEKSQLGALIMCVVTHDTKVPRFLYTLHYDMKVLYS